MKDEKGQLPVESFYKGRAEYSIIGLTGVAGSGCSSFAKLISNPELMFQIARKPEEFPVSFPTEKNAEKQKLLKDVDINASINSFVKKRKYEICYNYLLENKYSYEVIIKEDL